MSLLNNVFLLLQTVHASLNKVMKLSDLSLTNNKEILPHENTVKIKSLKKHHIYL